MIEQDYIKRLIQQFFEALAAVLQRAQSDGLTQTQVHQEFSGLCELYIRVDLDAVMRSSDDEFEQHIRGLAGDMGVEKLTMLAELLYHEAVMRRDQAIARRALAAMDESTLRSRTFSLTRNQRIDTLRNLCANCPNC